MSGPVRAHGVDQLGGACLARMGGENRVAGATGQPILPYHIESDRFWTLKSWDRTQIPRPFATVVLVIGAEGKGLRKPVKRACTDLARLPMSGVLDSLNASVAGGIALYELLRRRPR